MAVMLALLASLQSRAYDINSDDICYSILSDYNHTVEIAGLAPEVHKNEVVIPEEITYCADTYKVVAVGAHAFEGCSRFKSIILPNSITTIGNHAFGRSYGLSSIVIPNSVTTIGESAFQDCISLTSVTVPNSLTAIKYGTFWGCRKLTSVTIPNSVKTIGAYAFNNCTSLSSITIPSSVTSIASTAFAYCYALERINVDNENTNYTSIDGVLYSADKSTFICCPGARSSVIISEPTTTIGAYAFYENKNLSEIILPNSLTDILEYAFNHCTTLTAVKIPNSVTSIGDFAFDWCENLKSIELPKSLTIIGKFAFSSCKSLITVEIPNSVTTIEKYSFDECTNLKSINIPNSEIKIGEGVFCDCHLLEHIYCQRMEPLRFNPEFMPGFEDEAYRNAILYVPTGTSASYKKVSPWKYFWNIQEMEFSGINDVEVSSEAEMRVTVNDGEIIVDGIGDNENVAIYDMTGRVVHSSAGYTAANLAPGIYIVKAGKHTRKVVI